MQKSCSGLLLIKNESKVEDKQIFHVDRLLDIHDQYELRIILISNSR